MHTTALASEQIKARIACGPRRHVLILNQTFYPDVVSTAQHATDLALALVDAGYAVTVVTGARAYDNPRQRFPQRENYREIEIIRVGSTAFGKTARWCRAADFASYLVNCALRIAWLRRCDLVIAMTSPPLISWLASLMVPLKARNLLFWAMDLNPDEAIAAGWLRERSLAGRALAAMLKRSMRRARGVIALDRYMKERMIAKGVPAGKIVVVPPWAHDPVRFDASGRDEFRARHGFSDKFVVMYSGNHSPCHPLDTVFDAAQRLSGDPRIVFCFVGGGSEYGRLQGLARERRMANVLFLPYQPLEQLGASLSAADLHLVVMGDPFVGIIHPCKIYNVLRVGAPVLYVGPAHSHIADIFDQLHSAVFRTARHGDVEAVVAQISAAADQVVRPTPVEISFADRFSHQVLVTKMLEIVNATLQTANASR
jgi:colanic acid biosynthesis glycosyl transferase WcaI